VVIPEHLTVRGRALMTLAMTIDPERLRELAAELGFWRATTDEADIEQHRQHCKNADHWLVRGFEHAAGIGALCAHIQAGVVLVEHVVGAQPQLVADLAVEERVAHQAAEGPGLRQQIAAQCPVGTGGRSMGISQLVISLASSPTSGVGKSNSSIPSGVRVMMSLYVRFGGGWGP
jgi:hypothetical protein